MSVQLAEGPQPKVIPERRARILSGLPRPVDRSKSWLRRTVGTPWTWLFVALMLACVVGLWDIYATLHPDQHVQGHVVPGLNNEALREAAGLAARTAVVWILLFLALDRFRRVAVWMYVAALGWGACAAPWIAMNLNTWLSSLMGVQQSAGSDQASATRAAIFSAPFVEEACKATIVFALAILVRNRISSILQGAVLAGLSATGFAFTENIIYYARARVYASYQASAGDADQAVHQLFLLRGVYTSFGHMLFTSMTGIGIAVAVRTRSKLVRIAAPLTGYALAALLHMLFNGLSSTSSNSQLNSFYIGGLFLVGGVAVFLIGNVVRESRRIRNRLDDFVRMGWLPERDPAVFSRVRSRAWLLIVAARHGRRTWSATWHYIHDITDLAYTRDAMVRGVVDAAGDARELDLLRSLTDLRPLALTESRDLHLDIEWRRLLDRFRRRPAVPAPQAAWPAPVAASWPAPNSWPPPGGPRG